MSEQPPSRPSGDSASNSASSTSATHPLDRPNSADAAEASSARRSRGTRMQWSIGLLLVFTLVFGIVAAGVGYLLREDEQLMIQYIGLAVIVVAPGILMLFLKLSSLFRR